MIKKLIVGSLSVFLLAGIYGFHSSKELRVLIYTKNGEGYVHDNIDASVAAMEKIC